MFYIINLVNINVASFLTISLHIDNQIRFFSHCHCHKSLNSENWKQTWNWFPTIKPYDTLSFSFSFFQGIPSLSCQTFRFLLHMNDEYLYFFSLNFFVIKIRFEKSRIEMYCHKLKSAGPNINYYIHENHTLLCFNQFFWCVWKVQFNWPCFALTWPKDMNLMNIQTPFWNLFDFEIRLKYLNFLQPYRFYAYHFRLCTNIELDKKDEPFLVHQTTCFVRKWLKQA